MNVLSIFLFTIIVFSCPFLQHPAAGNPDGTLVNALLYHLDQLSGIGGELRPGIVHRLDKDTSGLLLVAKDDETHQALSAQLSARQMEKHYFAVVAGVMKERAGVIDAPIGRSKKNPTKNAIDLKTGKESVTYFHVLKRFRKDEINKLYDKTILYHSYSEKIHLVYQ